MEARARKAICRIDAVIPPRGSSRGAGALVAPDLVLTALHVVADRTANPIALHEDVRLTFPGFERTGTVVPGGFDAALDFALVRLGEPAPPEVEPLPMSDIEEGDRHVFRAFGFPNAFPEGLAISGTIEMVDTTYKGVRALQLHSIQAAAGIGAAVEGLSGAPCLVDGDIVGVLRSSLQRAADGQNVNVAGTLFACPAKDILAKTDEVQASAGGADPLALTTALPPEPFRYLAPYQEKDAEIFFGRREEIRRLVTFVRSRGSPPICLLRGPTGVGKSSLLSAGLVPRVKVTHHVIPVARTAGADLPATLRNALDLPADAKDATVREAWQSAEQTHGKPLLVLLDQLEEAYARGDGRGDDEVAELSRTAAAIFGDPATRPTGKLMLSFRKEWVDDVERAMAPFGLSYTREYIGPLDRSGILEALTGLRRTKRLRDHFEVDFPPELPGKIADELLRDRESPVAPMLQILLTRMWERAKDTRRAQGTKDLLLTTELFESLRAEGFGLPAFLDREIAALPDSLQPHVRSGLVWDLLEAHTTSLGTSQPVTRPDLLSRYAHVPGPATALADQLSRVGRLIGVVDVLVKGSAGPETTRATRLLHDTLGVLVRQRFATSDAPGPIARTLLETRGRAWEKASPGKGTADEGMSGDRLSRADLARVTRGLPGMRALTDGERKLVRASTLRRRQVNAAILLGVAGALTLAGALVRERVEGRDKEQQALSARAALQATQGTFAARQALDLAARSPDPVEAVVHLASAVDAAPDSDPLRDLYLQRTIHAFLEAPVVSTHVGQGQIDDADLDEGLTGVAYRREDVSLQAKETANWIHVQSIDLSDPVAGGAAGPARPVHVDDDHPTDFSLSPDGRSFAAMLFAGSDSGQAAVLDVASLQVVERLPLEWLSRNFDEQGRVRLDLTSTSGKVSKDAAIALEGRGWRTAWTPLSASATVLSGGLPKTSAAAIALASLQAPEARSAPYVWTLFEGRFGRSPMRAGITRAGRVDRYFTVPLPVHETGLFAVRFARLSPSADTLVLVGGGRARVVVATSPSRTLWEGEAKGIAEVALAPAGDRVAVASYDPAADRTAIRVEDVRGGPLRATSIAGRARWLTWTTTSPSRLRWSFSERAAADGCAQGVHDWAPDSDADPRWNERLTRTLLPGERATWDGACHPDVCGGTSPADSEVIPTLAGPLLQVGADLRLTGIAPGEAPLSTHFDSLDRPALVAAEALRTAPALLVQNGLLAKGSPAPPFELFSLLGTGELRMGARREPVVGSGGGDWARCLPRLDPTGRYAAWWSEDRLTITALSTGTRLADIRVRDVVEYGFLRGGQDLLIVTADGKIRTAYVQHPYDTKPTWMAHLAPLVSGTRILASGARNMAPGYQQGTLRKEAFDAICQAAKDGDRGAAQIVRRVGAARAKGPYCDLPD